LARFRQWFDEFDAKVWDDKFERVSKSGRLDKPANKAVAAFRAGKAKEL